MKVFISQPMSGIPDGEILKTREEITEALKHVYTSSDGIEILDNFNVTVAKPGHPLLYLSYDMCLLDEADLVVLAPGWSEARGCGVEYRVACLYDIPFISAVRKDDGTLGFRDYAAEGGCGE